MQIDWVSVCTWQNMMDQQPLELYLLLEIKPLGRCLFTEFASSDQTQTHRQTDRRRRKSDRRRRSNSSLDIDFTYQFANPCREAYALFVQDGGTWSKNRQFPRFSISFVIVNSPLSPRSSSFKDLRISLLSKFILSHSWKKLYVSSKFHNFICNIIS